MPLLADAGYRRIDESLVQRSPWMDGSPTIPRSGSTQPRRPHGWPVLPNLSPVAPAHRETMARMLRSIAAPVGFARVEDDGEPIAFALGVVDGDHVGLFDVLVAPKARRRGLARRLTESVVRLGPVEQARASPTCRWWRPTRQPCRSTPISASRRSTATAIACHSACKGRTKMSSHVWEKSYPPGVKWELDVPKKTIHQIFEDSCAQYGDRPVHRLPRQGR